MSDPTHEDGSFPTGSPPDEAAEADHHVHLHAIEGADAHDRPAPRLALALSGAGGAVLAAGLTAVIIGDDPTRAKGVAAGLLIVVTACAVRLLLRRSREVMSAALGAGAVGILVTVIAATADVDAATWPALALAALFGLAWLLPGFQGRPLMLGMAAAFAVVGLVAATAQLTEDSISFEECDRIYNEEGIEAMPDACFSDDLSSSGDPLSALVEGDTGPETTVAVICGALLMVGVFLLDRRGLSGTATALIPAGIVSTWTGLGAFVSSLDETVGPALVVIGGLLIGAVGNAGRRRATTWWGALIAVAGTIAFVVSIVEPDSPTSIGGSLLLSGLVLVAAATVAVVLHDRPGTAAPTATIDAPPPAG